MNIRMLAVILLMAACAPSVKTDPIRKLAVADEGPPQLCAAVRGNGELVMSHFASYAKLTETKGIFNAMAGGSSATISIFIYESILLNPAVQCATCSEADRRLRVSFLLKSIWEYVAVLGQTKEAKIIFKGIQLLSEKDHARLVGLLANPAQLALAQKELLEILNSPELAPLINQELLSMLSDKNQSLQLQKYHMDEALAALQTFGKFDPTDKKIFFRPGALSFAGLADKVGRLANFYAGRGSFYNHQGMKTLLDQCSPRTEGKRWSQIAKLHPECAAKVHGLIKDFRHELEIGRTAEPSRLDDNVGDFLKVLVSDAVLTNTKSFEAGLARYRSNEQFESFQFHPFNDIKYGVWSSAEVQHLIDPAKSKFTDLKTKKRLPLGPVSWKTALSHSPAEPGLARIDKIRGTGMASMGGWPDLHPVLLLRDVGCQKVVFVTRRGEDSPFAKGVARNLGMTPVQEKALYSLDSPTSSFSVSLANATGSHCTNWDVIKPTEGERMDVDAFNAPFVTFKTSPGIRGCGGLK